MEVVGSHDVSLGEGSAGREIWPSVRKVLRPVSGLIW